MMLIIQEKFSKWSDRKGTGINPFVPPTEKDAPLSPSLIFSWLLFVPRALICGVALGMLYLSSVVGKHVPWSIRGMLERVWAGLVLYFACPGGYELKKLAANRVGLGEDSSKPRGEVLSGDVLFSNWTGPLDVLLWCVHFSPLFCLVEPGGSGVRVVGTWEALVASCGKSEGKWAKAEVEISRYLGNGPLVVFCEGGRTNNRAVLKFSPAVESIQDVLVGESSSSTSSKTSIAHSFAIRHHEKRHGVFPAGDLQPYIFRLLRYIQSNNAISLLQLPPNYDPQPHHKDFSQKCRAAISDMLRITSETKFDATDYQEFLQAFAQQTTN